MYVCIYIYIYLYVCIYIYIYMRNTHDIYGFVPSSGEVGSCCSGLSLTACHDEAVFSYCLS